MSQIPGIVTEPCDPYPTAPDYAAWEKHSDERHSHHLTQVLAGLGADEIAKIARTLGLLHPRDFEQELLFIQESRERHR